MKMVGDDGVEQFSDINYLPESAGAFAALNAKANFQRVPHFFDDPIDVRRVLIAKREEIGADTPYGHTCSNIVEILDTWLVYQPQPWATHPSQTLAGKMNYQIGRLERLSAKGAV
jgi:hypothetical protein